MANKKKPNIRGGGGAQVKIGYEMSLKINEGSQSGGEKKKIQNKEWGSGSTRVTWDWGWGGQSDSHVTKKSLRGPKLKHKKGGHIQIRPRRSKKRKV